MKVDRVFLRRVVFVILGVAIVAAYPLAHYGSRDVIAAAAAGAALSTVNALLGFLAIEYAFDRSYTTFLKVVVGGMGVRMLLMLGALAALLMVFRMQVVALTVSMFGFYLIYLVLEVLFIQRKVLTKDQG